MSYTSSNAFAGNATVLERSATSGGTYTPFAEILKITPAKPTSGKVKVTNMQSVGAKEYKPDPLIEPGDYEFDANMTDTDNVFCRANIGVIMYFKIIFNNAISSAGTTRAFKGWIAEVSEENVEPEKYVTHKIKITVTGLETVTAAS